MQKTLRPPFLSLPNEIHIEILKKCTTFTQAVALTAACKQLQSIWKNHQKAVLAHIGNNCIVAFDDALRAVRAIHLAERQYQSMALLVNGVEVASEERPPIRISIKRLGAFSAPPSPEELSRVFDIRHFVEASLAIGHQEKHIHIFCQQSSSAIKLPKPCPFGIESSQTDSSAEEIDFKIYASMYRFFLISAALSSVYWEPFFTDDPLAPSLRIALRGPLPDSPYWMTGHLSRDERQYFARWPCYNKRFSSQSQLDEIFGELGEYIIERGRMEAAWNTDTKPNAHISGDRDIGTAGSVQALMMIIGCHEFFWCVAQHQLHCAGKSVETGYYWHQDIKYSSIPVTFLGIHGALDAYVPSIPETVLRHPHLQFHTRAVGVRPDGVPISQIRLLRLFHEMLDYERTLSYDGFAGSHLPYELGFFEYILRRHFGVRVQFAWGYGQTTYSKYLAHGTSFRSVEPFKRDIPDILSRCTP